MYICRYVSMYICSQLPATKSWPASGWSSQLGLQGQPAQPARPTEWGSWFARDGSRWLAG